eukprot:352421-Chlamydomonas_euryale.AAC.89
MQRAWRDTVGQDADGSEQIMALHRLCVHLAHRGALPGLHFRRPAHDTFPERSLHIDTVDDSLHPGV